MEMLNAATGELLAADGNANGDLTQPGDLLIGDHDNDGSPDLLVDANGLVELAVLVYPLSANEAPGEVKLQVQIKDGSGWQDAAVDLLR